MIQIDWSKAPEGATHFDCREYVSPAFMRKNHNGRDWEYFGMSYWIMYGQLSADQAAKLIVRPKEWTGEGLPPVGIECEVMGGGLPSTAFDWERCTILLINEGADGKQQVCTRDFRGDLAIYYPEIDAVYFRPIRTPEQVAAEVREGAIHEMVDHLKRWNTVQDLCGDLYDAGYRKFEIVED